MKASRELNVSSQEFYQTFYNSLKQEIEVHTNKTYPKIYQGMNYKQELLTYTKSKRTVEVKIEKLVENEEYLASFKSPTDTNTVSFKIDKLGENKCYVTYEETYASDEGIKELNFSLVSIIINPFKKRKAKKKLKAMEKYIIMNRKNF